MNALLLEGRPRVGKKAAMDPEFPKRVQRRKAAALAGAMLLLAGADHPQGAPRFAIGCTGTARFTDDVTGERISREYELPRQVYVLDEGARRVRRALEPRQEFEDVCFHDGYIDSAIFAPGLVSVRSEKPGALCDFSVSRVTGEGHYFFRGDLPEGRFSQIEFRMMCGPTEIPVFERSRNRF